MKFELKGSAWEVVTVTLAGLSLLLVIVNAALVVRNQALQAEVNERQQTINQGLQYARLRQTIAQLLSNLAIAKDDHDISELLSRHGISSNGAPATATAPQGK